MPADAEISCHGHEHRAGRNVRNGVPLRASVGYSLKCFGIDSCDERLRIRVLMYSNVLTASRGTGCSHPNLLSHVDLLYMIGICSRRCAHLTLIYNKYYAHVDL